MGKLSTCTLKVILKFCILMRREPILLLLLLFLPLERSVKNMALSCVLSSFNCFFFLVYKVLKVPFCHTNLLGSAFLYVFWEKIHLYFTHSCQFWRHSHHSPLSLPLVATNTIKQRKSSLFWNDHLLSLAGLSTFFSVSVEALSILMCQNRVQ